MQIRCKRMQTDGVKESGARAEAETETEMETEIDKRSDIILA